MRTQIFDASGLATPAFVQACRGLNYRQWSLSTELTLSLSLSLLCKCEEDLKYRSKTAIRCVLTQVYVHSRGLYNQQHVRSQLGPVKL